MAFLRRLLRPVVELREEELLTVVMMFAYSFLAMTSYTALKPVTRSQFISDLGADNLPIVQFAFGLLIGFIMQGYATIVARLPKRFALPMTQAGLVALLVVFYVWFRSGSEWASTGFYFFGLILGILLISQFWTLANEVYNPRQAKRIFGFIGGGASLGGIAGSSLALKADVIGTTNLLLVSAVLMTVCLLLVTAIIRREKPEIRGSLTGGEDEGVGGSEAIRLLRDSRHLQLIALIISFAAIGAAIIEQQLNMATEAAKGASNTDAITSFLGEVQLYTSVIGFIIQVWLTSKIQRYLGIGFALLILPTSLGLTGTLMLLNGALWAPALARVVDTSLRYTVDKTTREILFLPLPNELKQQSKPFIDVTVDRFSKGVGALLVLVLIKDDLFGLGIGLGLDWPQLSWASLVMTALWITMALRAKREYQSVFRRSIERQDVKPMELRVAEADLSTVETLVEELGHPDPRHVLYSIDMLESLEKRHLISPLLLNHEADQVRARALQVVDQASAEVRERWKPGVERLLKDPSPAVRAAAVRSLAAIRGQAAVGLMRPYLQDRDPRLVATAAVALAGGDNPADVEAAAEALERLANDNRTGAAQGRREAAAALGQLDDPRFHRILVGLMYDGDRDVALEAIKSAGRLGASDFLFVPPLVSMLRRRLLKGTAREVLVGYGEGVIDTLAYFLRDPDEDVWVRRHMPSTLARIPGQQSVDVLLSVLDQPDGFLRYKAAGAIGRIRLEKPDVKVPGEPIERLLQREANRYFNAVTLHYNLTHKNGGAADTLLARALDEKRDRAVNRIYLLLALVYPPADIAAARWAIENGDARVRASAAEYLDNVLSGALRKKVMPVLEDLPLEEKVRRGHLQLRSRLRDAEDTLAQLVHDEDQVVAAAAIHFVEQHGLWSLADDLEYALAHRDVRDWSVFEAASWALAGRRLTPEQRRYRWLEPLPAVELADRLRRLPLFTFVSVDELFRIASTGRQVRHDAGDVLCEAGAPVDEVHFLLDGEVSVADDRGPAGRLSAPAVIAFEEVFEGVPGRCTVKATGIAVTLAVDGDQLLSMLSENSELAQGLFHTLLDRLGDAGAGRVLKGAVRTMPPASRLAGGLQTVEKALILAEMPAFAHASADQLAQLAQIAREVRLEEGAVLFREGDAPSIFVILDGELSLELMSGGEPVFAGPGDTVGVYETLCGLNATGWRGHVTRQGVALAVEREPLFDLLADQIPVLQGLFSALRRRRETPTEAVGA